MLFRSGAILETQQGATGIGGARSAARWDDAGVGRAIGQAAARADHLRFVRATDPRARSGVIREGGILSPESDDAKVTATRQTLQAMGEHPRLDTAVIQTVGAKHWDGFAIALVR